MMVGKPKWLDTGPVVALDTYRVRPGGDGYFVMEHRDGRVEVYARLVGHRARERAERIADDANRKGAA